MKRIRKYELKTIKKNEPSLTQNTYLIIKLTRSALLNDVNFEVIDISVKSKFINKLNNC